MTARPVDPVLKNARREALVIFAAWLACVVYCCGYCYAFGYDREGHHLGAEDVHPILGMPSWVFWGVMAPWAVCGMFTFWFAGFVMADDDLGIDHEKMLDDELRDEGLE